MAKLNIKTPYLGFENYYPRPFETKDGKFYFGRNKDLQIIKDLLRQKHFLALISSPQTGKTSFLQAGLMYDLEENGLLAQAGSAWRIAFFEPLENPIEELAKAIAQPGILFKNKVRPNFEINVRKELNEKKSNNNGLVHLCEEADTLENSNLLLVIDNFGDTFHKIAKPVKQKFFNLLLNAVNDPSIPVYILITLNKSDLLSGMINEYPALLRKIRSSQYSLHPLQESGLMQAIKLHRLMQNVWVKFKAETKDYSIQGIVTKHFHQATGTSPQRVIKSKSKPGTGENATLQDEELEIPTQEMQDNLLFQLPLSQQVEEIVGELAVTERIAARRFFQILLFKPTSSSPFELRKIDQDKLSVVMDYPLEDLNALVKKFKKVLEISDNELQLSSTSIADDWPRFEKWWKGETENIHIYEMIIDAAKKHYIDAKPIEVILQKAELEAILAWDNTFYLAQEADWASLYNAKSYKPAINFLGECRKFLGVVAPEPKKKKVTVTPKPKKTISKRVVKRKPKPSANVAGKLTPATADIKEVLAQESSKTKLVKETKPSTTPRPKTTSVPVKAKDLKKEIPSVTKPKTPKRKKIVIKKR